MPGKRKPPRWLVVSPVEIPPGRAAELIAEMFGQESPLVIPYESVEVTVRPDLVSDRILGIDRGALDRPGDRLDLLRHGS